MNTTTPEKRKFGIDITLVGVLIYAFFVWAAALRVQFSGDDFQYLHSLAPIREFGDILKPFFMHDINPSVFRPLANLTFVSDFLLYGWDPLGFHLTNLLLHVIATAFVFFTARNIFGLERRLAIGAAFLFGILGSHDFNILTSTARADILVAIFTMATLLCEWKADKAIGSTFRRFVWKLFGLISMSLALFSKEVAIMILPMMVLLFDITPWSFNRKALVAAIKRLWPYVILTAAWYVYHAYYTGAPSSSQPLQSDAMSSPAALVRNALYGIGYMFLPLDLKTATLILTQYKIPALIVGVGLISGMTLLLIRSLKGIGIRVFYAPFVFSLLSGLLVVLSFERWRLYTPSVGGVALFALVFGLVGERYQSRWAANTRRLFLYGYLIFNSIHAVLICLNWAQSTARLTRYKDELGKLLTPLSATWEAGHMAPLDLTFIDVPSKLGSASVLQLGLEDIVKQAVAEGRYPRQAAQCDVRHINLETHSAAEVYALDHDIGFDELRVSRISPNEFDLQVPPTGSTVLIPALGFVSGVARRDWTLKTGETVQLDRATVVIEKANGPTASQLLVRINDTNTVPILFEKDDFSIAR